MLTYFTLPNRVIFGPDASQRVGKEARKMGMSSVLLVTDPGLVACGIAELMEANLRETEL